MHVVRTVSTTLLLLGSLNLAAAQGRAYEDFVFGDSPQTVADKLVQHSDIRFGGIVPLTELGFATPSLLLNSKLLIATIDDVWFTLHFQFFDDKLYRVTLESVPLPASAIASTVETRMTQLRNMVSTTQGGPDIRAAVGPEDTQSGSVVWSDVWTTNRDGIAYFIGMGQDASQYFAALWIQWTWLKNLRDQAMGKAFPNDAKRAVHDF